MNDATLTAPQTLLVVALDLGEPFHESDLCLAAWKRSTRLFGLRTHETEHPDLNRVRSALCHRGGPVEKGHLARCGKPLTYKLTPGGRAEAKAIKAGQRNGHKIKTLRLPDDIEEELGRMLFSRAWKNFLMGRPICWHDALQFWGATHSTNGHPQAALELVDDCLRDCDDYRTSEGLNFRDGRVVSDKELNRLRACDQSLREAFKKELARKGGG